MKNLLDHRERPTWRAACCLVAVGLIALAASVPPASAQGGAGVRAGFSVDPDQFFIGGHFVTSPIWDRLRFQPNVEAGFGDDRTVIAFNMEFGYWMPVNADWHAYVAAGPAMNIFSGNGNGKGNDGDDVGPGLTVGVGLRRRGGLFFEVKVGAFDSPDFKMAVGYTFR